MSNGPSSQLPLLAAIDAATKDARIRLAMLFGSTQEGGIYGPWGTAPGGPAVGDSGWAFGPFQMNLHFHPGVTPQQAADPYFAAGFMAHAYEAAAATIPDSLWKTNPELAAEQTAFRAERPAQDYRVSHGQKAVDSGFAEAMRVLGGKGAVGGGGAALGGAALNGSAVATDASLTSGIGGAFLTSMVGPIPALFGAGDLKDLVERGALILFGGLLVLVGLVMLLKDTAPAQAAKDVGLIAATGGEYATVRGAVRGTARDAARSTRRRVSTSGAGQKTMRASKRASADTKAEAASVAAS